MLGVCWPIFYSLCEPGDGAARHSPLLPAAADIPLLRGQPTSTLILPPVLLDHVCQLDDELALLVLLTRLERLLVLPAQRRLAAVTVDVSHSVQAGEQDPLFGRPTANVDHGVEEVCPALRTLEALADQLIVIGQVGAAVHAGVSPVARGQVSPEGLDHLWYLLVRQDGGRVGRVVGHHANGASTCHGCCRLLLLQLLAEPLVVVLVVGFDVV